MHGLGNEAIAAQYFVECRDQQRVVNEIDTKGERAFDSGHHHIEIVEGAERDLPCRAALRRVRVDVVELFEAERILQIPERRHTVPPRRSCLRAAYPDG